MPWLEASSGSSRWRSRVCVLIRGPPASTGVRPSPSAGALLLGVGRGGVRMAHGAARALEPSAQHRTRRRDGDDVLGPREGKRGAGGQLEEVLQELQGG